MVVAARGAGVRPSVLRGGGRRALGPLVLALVLGVPACTALNLLSPYAPLVVVAIGGYLAAAVAAPGWALAGVGLLIPLEDLRVSLGGGLGALSPARAGLLVVAAGWCARALLWPRRVAAVSWRDAPAVVLIAAVPLGLAFGAEASAVAKVTVNWAAYLVVGLVVRELDSPGLRRVLMGFGLGGAVLGVEGVVNYVAGGGAHLSNGGAAVYGRAAAGLSDSNYYGGLLVVLLVPVLALAVRERGRGRAVAAASACAMGAGVALSLSRGAILALALAVVLVLAAWSPSRRASAALLAALAVALPLNAGPLLGSREVQVVGERLASVQVVSGTNTRPLLWRASLHLVEEHPEGVGVLGFPAQAEQLGLTERGRPLEHAHNGYLNIAVELGVLGLAAYVALLGQALLLLWREWRVRDPRTSALAVGIGSALMAFAFQSLTVSLYAVQLLQALSLVLVGAAIGLPRLRAQD